MARGFRIVDLTRIVVPGKERFACGIKTFMADQYVPGINRRPDDWYVIQELTVCSHVGSHVESPFHHLRHGMDCSQLSIERCLGEAAVIDLTHKGDREYITRADLDAHGVHVKEGDIVLLREGWSQYYGTPRYMQRPFLDYEAAEWLVGKRPAMLGVDASGIERNEDVGQPIHRLIFEQGIPLIEDLTNLESLRTNRPFLICLPLKIEGLDASPARIVALEGLRIE